MVQGIEKQREMLGAEERLDLSNLGSPLTQDDLPRTQPDMVRLPLHPAEHIEGRKSLGSNL